MCAPKTAHLMVHYFEEEAVKSYSAYLELVESGAVQNVSAPSLAIEYYGLASDARLSDLIRCVRADEQHHAIANARFAEARETKAHGIAARGLQPEIVADRRHHHLT